MFVVFERGGGRVSRPSTKTQFPTRYEPQPAWQELAHSAVRSRRPQPPAWMAVLTSAWAPAKVSTTVVPHRKPFMTPYFFRKTLAITALLCSTFAFAAPTPLATLRGELRNFSPDGRYAAVFEGTGVVLYEVAGWKRLGEARFKLARSVSALLVDNDGRLAGLYDDQGTWIEIWEWKDRLAGVGAVKLAPAGSITLDNYQIVVEGMGQIYRGIRAAYDDSKKRILHEGERYTPFNFRCSPELYLTLAPRLTAKTTPEEIKAHGCKANETGPSSFGGPGRHRVWQSDLIVSETTSYWVYTGHPAHGPGEFVERDGKASFSVISPSRTVEYTTKPGSTEVIKISTAQYDLLAGPAWQIRPKAPDAPAFELAHLKVAGYVPRRVSPEGKLIAFSNGEFTKVFAAETVLDRYAGMDPAILQDLLMEKISAALRDKRAVEALPHFERLAKTGAVLPESFYYYRIETLEAAGKKADARESANQYLEKYGKKGKYYSQVISLLARL